MVPWHRGSMSNGTSSRPSSGTTAAPAVVNVNSRTMTMNSRLVLNRPESPPVAFNPRAHARRSHRHLEEDEERCRNCHSVDLITDWPQGDRVCRGCGVVAEGHVMDDRPEWKDFNEAEDLAKGAPSKSRSGLVPVDESRYVGGLQPTALSKHAFGENSGGYGMARIRKQLRATNKKLDRLMEKGHKQALQDAKLERKIILKKSAETDQTDGNPVRSEFDTIVLQEEEDAHRLHTALYADKWSLQRAILLYGNSDDHSLQSINPAQDETDREELLSQLDGTLKKASQDLYTAYSMITRAAQKLHLPERVMNEVVHRLVRYAIRRDGFIVKGVSSRLSKDTNNESKQKRKDASERLREYNKMKQMGSLGAAILFLTARNLGWARTVVEICESFAPWAGNSNEKVFLKPKHCSRAVAEIKSFFPEYARPPVGSTAEGLGHGDGPQRSSNESLSVSNFADHFTRKLQLPPVAEASTRVLLAHCRQEQVEFGQNSGTKMSTLCAAVVYFVCCMGSVMQKVARQVQLDNDGKDASPPPTSTKRNYSNREQEYEPPPKKRRHSDRGTKSCMEPEHTDYDNSEKQDEEPFDVFTHSAIVEDRSQKLEYEMRRMWDAWAEQMPWSRSFAEIEQSCGVSRNTVMSLYKADLYPRRETLLGVLKDTVSKTEPNNRQAGKLSPSSLPNTPLASILLAHISTAGALMSDR
mmetsp:Transcript_24153/g.42439  ORF Transcript_24153/g.42439 Transcript_24153/m.42439 type:complete len:697 (+) Transcript_24153:104-2194(+)